MTPHVPCLHASVPKRNGWKRLRLLTSAAFEKVVHFIMQQTSFKAGPREETSLKREPLTKPMPYERSTRTTLPIDSASSLRDLQDPQSAGVVGCRLGRWSRGRGSRLGRRRDCWDCSSCCSCCCCRPSGLAFFFVSSRWQAVNWRTVSMSKS